jgi:hypothetical protein
MEAVLKKSIAVVWAVLILMVVLLTVPALAGTRDDCIAKCKEAGEFIKKQGIDTAAIKEIGNKKDGQLRMERRRQLCVPDGHEGQDAGPPAQA